MKVIITLLDVITLLEDEILKLIAFINHGIQARDLGGILAEFGGEVKEKFREIVLVVLNLRVELHVLAHEMDLGDHDLVDLAVEHTLLFLGALDLGLELVHAIPHGQVALARCHRVGFGESGVWVWVGPSAVLASLKVKSS